MKKTFTFCAIAMAFLFSSCGQKEQSSANYEVIPLPQEITMVEGKPFILKNSTTIVYPKGNADLQRIANFLSDYIKFSTGKVLKVTDDATDDNVILLESNLASDHNEGYTLEVTDKKIEINGASAAGTFYGAQTLRKSIDANSEKMEVVFPSTKIVDYPRFEYRGMHLDVGRHMFPLEFIKRYIDLLALHNMNTFHWHLTEDQGWRIEIKKYPELIEKGSVRKHTVIGHNSGKFDETPYGGYYTQDEAREIVKYAEERFITVIPEIDLPGHMLAALAAFPNLGCTGGPYEPTGEWGVFDDVLCAGNEEVYTFLKNVYSEILDIFPSEYIHIGGDESPKTRWKECPKCQAKIKELGLKSDKDHTSEERLQSHVISEMEKFLNSKGRKIIGWDEILEGGLAPNATVMSWRGTEGAKAAAKAGHDAIMTPNTYLYFDYYQTTDTKNEPIAIGGYLPLSKVYSFNPILSDLNEDEAKHIKGVQANVWTEYMPDFKQVEYMIMPRMDALAEIQWTMPSKKNYDIFLQRLLRMLKLYDKNGYNYSKTIFAIQSEIKNNSDAQAIELTLSTIDNAPIYYTTDGTEPNAKSTKYTGTISIKESTDVKAVAVRKTGNSPIFEKNFQMNKATMKPIQSNQQPHAAYAGGGISTLVDGIDGNPKNYKDGSWLGFQNGDLELTLDLQKETEVSKIDFNTYVCTGDWIFGVKDITVSASDNGKDYKVIAKADYPIPTKHEEGIVPHEIKFAPVETQYLKLQISKINKMPEWHAGAGTPAFLFIDEVKVN